MRIDPINIGHYVIPDDACGGTCIDVGANVGSFMEFYGNKFSKIHFYEPIKQCFYICREKTKHLSFVTGFNEAVYHTADVELPLVEHLTHHCGSVGLKTDSLNADWTNEIVGTTRTCDFPRVLERMDGRVDYMKVDCETSEYHFMINRDLSGIKYIGLELSWQMGQTKYDELLAHIYKTHATQDDVAWRHSLNREGLFVRKSL